MKNFSKRLKKAREEQNMTQTEIAELLNIKQNSYARIESGNHDIKMSNIYNICKILDISADWLLGLDDHNIQKSSSNS